MVCPITQSDHKYQMYWKYCNIFQLCRKLYNTDSDNFKCKNWKYGNDATEAKLNNNFTGHVSKQRIIYSGSTITPAKFLW